MGLIRPVVPIAPTLEPGAIAQAVSQARAAHSVCDLNCSRCTRRLAIVTKDTTRIPRLLLATLVSLDDSDYCRWCARPVTEEAERTVPREGYVMFARMILGARTCGRADALDLG